MSQINFALDSASKHAQTSLKQVKKKQPAQDKSGTKAAKSTFRYFDPDSKNPLEEPRKKRPKTSSAVRTTEHFPTNGEFFDSAIAFSATPGHATGSTHNEDISAFRQGEAGPQIYQFENPHLSAATDLPPPDSPPPPPDAPFPPQAEREPPPPLFPTPCQSPPPAISSPPLVFPSPRQSPTPSIPPLSPPFVVLAPCQSPPPAIPTSPPLATPRQDPPKTPRSETPLPPSGVYDQKPISDRLKEIFPEGDVAFHEDKSKYAVWAGSHVTRLPFIPERGTKENALKYLSEHLGWLVTSVQDARGSPYVDYYDFNDYKNNMVGLGKAIRKSMSQRKMVVIENYDQVPEVELTLESLLEKLHISKREEFTVHDSLRREKHFSNPYYENITTEKFIQNMQDPNKIQCILDCAASCGPPPLIGHVDEGYVAVHKQMALRNISDAPRDLNLSRCWVIIHHPFFFTYVHHDASGTATWTMICSGYKFWILVVSKDNGKCKTLEELFEHNNRFRYQKIDGKWTFPYMETSETYCVFGKPGDMIIQFTDAWHEVYTPCKSVTIGGHFFTYDTLHFTDAARAFDLNEPGTTNQHHMSAQLTLSAMLLQIIQLDRKGYYRKPLTSLCRMLLRPDMYLIPDEDNHREIICHYINLALPKRKIPGFETPLDTKPDLCIRKAIRVADCLVTHFKLDYDNEEHLFSPMPWTAKGDEVNFTLSLISRMKKIASQEV